MVLLTGMTNTNSPAVLINAPTISRYGGTIEHKRDLCHVIIVHFDPKWREGVHCLVLVIDNLRIDDHETLVGTPQ